MLKSPTITKLRSYMKKNLVFVFILTTCFAFAQTPSKQNLANIASITFPSSPQVSDTLGFQVLKYSDSIAHYLVIAQDLSKEAGFKLKKEELNEFYDGNIEGVLKAAGGKLISKKPFQINGLKGLDVEYSASNPDLPNLRFKRILFINNIIFSLDFWVSSENEVKSREAKDRFFNSLVITADKANLKQNTDIDTVTAVEAGYVAGQIIFYISLFAIIAIIVVLIRKRNRKLV